MAAAKNTSKSAPAAASAPPSRILWRPKLLAVLAVIAALGVGGRVAWQRVEPIVAQHPQYKLTADGIRITPPPAWIHADVKSEVLRESGLTDSLSVLEDSERLQQRVRDAFAYHPWVASVGRVTVSLPASVEVELQYRRLVAAVEIEEKESVTYIPVDETGIRLPEAGFSEVELRYLPRITGITGRPGVGQRWTDPRVTDGAALAAKLADVWSNLRLVEIIPSLNFQVRGESRYFTFEITTSGGTRIVWGAAPGQEQEAAESPFDVKRKRLLDYASQKGKLDSIDGPAAVDVRSDLVITPRTARRTAAEVDTATETK